VFVPSKSANDSSCLVYINWLFVSFGKIWAKAFCNNYLVCRFVYGKWCNQFTMDYIVYGKIKVL
jgi:hypothetical protein